MKKYIDTESLMLDLNESVNKAIKAYKIGACWRGKVKAIYISTSFLYNHCLDKVLISF